MFEYDWLIDFKIIIIIISNLERINIWLLDLRALMFITTRFLDELINDLNNLEFCMWDGF